MKKYRKFNKKNVFILVLLILLSIMFRIFTLNISNKILVILSIFFSYLAVLKFTAVISGWETLSQKFSISYRKNWQLRKTFVTRCVSFSQFVHYSIFSKVFYCSKGIILKTILICKIFHKILLIPWDQIKEIEMEDQKMNYNNLNIMKPIVRYFYNVENYEIFFVSLKISNYENINMRLPYNLLMQKIIKEKNIKLTKK